MGKRPVLKRLGWEGPEDSSFRLQPGRLAFPSWPLGVCSFTNLWSWLADARGQ